MDGNHALTALNQTFHLRLPVHEDCQRLLVINNTTVAIPGKTAQRLHRVYIAETIFPEHVSVSYALHDIVWNC